MAAADPLVNPVANGVEHFIHGRCIDGVFLPQNGMPGIGFVVHLGLIGNGHSPWRQIIAVYSPLFFWLGSCSGVFGNVSLG